VSQNQNCVVAIVKLKASNPFGLHRTFCLHVLVERRFILSFRQICPEGLETTLEVERRGQNGIIRTQSHLHIRLEKVEAQI
jgi:hypothetical protein